MTKHLLTDDILADYASGNLGEAFSLVVAAHASIVPDARARLDEIEDLGGAVIDGLETAPMAADSLAATMALIAQGPAPEPKPKPETPDCAVLPAPVRDYVGGGLKDIRWRALGMGCKQAILAHDGDESVRLLYIPAGVEMPDHGHHGTEMTLVLQGAFLDGDDRFARGDIEVADEGTEHHPVADIGEDCICIVACAGNLRFNAFLPRIAQPFFRI